MLTPYGVKRRLTMNILNWSMIIGVLGGLEVLGTDFAQKCHDFRPQEYIANATSVGTQYVAAGTNLTFLDNDPSCPTSYQIVPVDLCRVLVSIPTSNDSAVDMELWLPQSWTGRFLGTGNGGLGGCIKYPDIEYGASHGFAAVGSNNGHNGNSGKPFYRHPEAVIDFAWRAIHTSVSVGKTLTRGFFGQSPRKSYYLGCSLGGLQGIRSAYEFPNDFDGIIAGSPALDFNDLESWRASFFPITGSTESPDFITRDQWSGLIHEEVLHQCDGIDRVEDGIIEDPTACNFQPDALRCEENQMHGCLTPAQVETVRRVFSPLEYDQGQLIYPAMQPGSEIEAAKELYTGKPFPYSEDWFRYVVYSPSWDPSTFNTHDARAADDLNPGGIRTWPDTLSAFQQAGGKLIAFHGQQDGKITSFNSERFYGHLSQGMKRSPLEMDEFFRFFRISGMFHCQSGPGAWGFGQGGGSPADGVPFVKERNILAALVAWVEEGQPPDVIQGTKFLDDDPEAGEAIQRSHCRYPLHNTYAGGDPALPGSWACRPPESGKRTTAYLRT